MAQVALGAPARTKASSRMELTEIMTVVGSIVGLSAIALLGTLLAVSNWVRLLAWQRFSSLLVQTAATHIPALWLVSRLSGLDFLLLMSWDAAIFAACYV